MPRSFWLLKMLVRTGIARWLPSIRRRLDGGASYLRYLSDRCLATPLDELMDLSTYWRADLAGSIDFAGLAPRFELPPPAPRTASARGYPPLGGLPDLRAAVADHLGASGLSVSPTDELLVTAGATAAFTVALDTFVNPGNRVVMFAPTSPLFHLGLKHRRARIQWVQTTTEAGRMRLPMEAFTKALPGAKLLVFSQPSNPTGGVFAPEDLDQIAWWANKFDVLIYCDESFARFRDDEHISLGALKPAAKRTLTAGSITHGWGLAAARVGWLAGCRHLLRPCAATQASSNPFVPVAGQLAALGALRQPEESFIRMRETVATRRRYAIERLTSAFGTEPDAGSLFVWLPVMRLGLTGRGFAELLYAEKRVLVTPGDLYGPGGDGYVRLSMAIDDGRLREGLSRVAELVADLRPPAIPTELIPEVAAEEPVAAA